VAFSGALLLGAARVALGPDHVGPARVSLTVRPPFRGLFHGALAEMSWSWARAGATSRSATRARRRASCAPQHQRQGEPEQQRSDAALLKRMDTVAALTGCQLLLRNVETLVGVIDILLDLIKQRLNLRAQAPGSGGAQVRALASPKPAAETVAA